jgi:hypothetical protein
MFEIYIKTKETMKLLNKQLFNHTIVVRGTKQYGCNPRKEEKKQDSRKERNTEYHKDCKQSRVLLT